MKKEVFNILFLAAVVVVVGWMYWPDKNNTKSSVISHEQNYVLAISWQPAFCESKPNKPECRSQRKGRYDTKNFSLHGLWPQPRGNVYCNLSNQLINTDKKGRWRDLPKLELSENTRKSLTKLMPGYRSNLHRHEWYKHGTCMGRNITPEGYFAQSIENMEELNTSILRDLFAENIGKQITSAQILKFAERAFGSEIRNRISISCKRDGKRTLINEIKISMSFNPRELTNIFYALNNAPELPIGCKRGIVDPVGLQ